VVAGFYENGVRHDRSDHGVWQPMSAWTTPMRRPFLRGEALMAVDAVKKNGIRKVQTEYRTKF
jgi:hypothetical protein